MGFYGTKIAFSASKPNAAERRTGKSRDSALNTTIAFKIEFFDRLPIEKLTRLVVPLDRPIFSPSGSLDVTHPEFAMKAAPLPRKKASFFSDPARFGKEYDDYRAPVPKFLPVIRRKRF